MPSLQSVCAHLLSFVHVPQNWRIVANEPGTFEVCSKFGDSIVFGSFGFDGLRCQAYKSDRHKSQSSSLSDEASYASILSVGHLKT